MLHAWAGGDYFGVGGEDQLNEAERSRAAFEALLAGKAGLGGVQLSAKMSPLPEI